MTPLISRRALSLLASVALGVTAVAGCGSSSSSSTTSSSASASTTATSSSSGKKAIPHEVIGIDSNFLASPISEQNEAGVLAACKAVGWTCKYEDGQGSPQQQLANANALVTEGVNAIITDSIQANTIEPALIRAKAAHIPVIAMGGDVPASSLFAAKYTEDETDVGAAIARVLTETVHHADIGEITNSLQSGVQRHSGLKSVLASPAGNGGKIVASFEPDLANLVPSTQQGLTGMLTAHPDINAIYSVFDTFVQPALPVLKSHASVKLFAVYLSPTTYAALKSNTALAGIANVDLPLTGIVAVDQLVNHFASGAAIDPNAMQQHPLSYASITKANLPASATVLNSPAKLLPPFLSEWSAKYQLPAS